MSSAHGFGDWLRWTLERQAAARRLASTSPLMQALCQTLCSARKPQMLRFTGRESATSTAAVSRVLNTVQRSRQRDLGAHAPRAGPSGNRVAASGTGSSPGSLSRCSATTQPRRPSDQVASANDQCVDASRRARSGNPVNGLESTRGALIRSVPSLRNASAREPSTSLPTATSAYQSRVSRALGSCAGAIDSLRGTRA